MTPRVVTAGEALGLIRSTETGSMAQVSDARLSVGGAEFNVAVGLSRLGVAATWIGRVGDDPFGRRIARELAAEGVDAHVIVDSEAPTALMLKETLPLGRTAVTFYRRESAGSRLQPEDVRIDLTGVGIVHITGIPLALSSTAAGAIGELVDRATALAIPVSFDVNHRPSLWDADRASAAYRALLGRATIVFGGRDELEMLVGAGLSDRELANRIRAHGPRQVVVKRGEKGAAVLTDDGWFEAAAVAVNVVDTVGAGDAFVAGYLASNLSATDVNRALALATRTGAAACTHPGDWEGALRIADRNSAGGDPVAR